MAAKKAKTVKKVSINIYLDMQNQEERGIADALELINSAKLSEEAKGPIIKCIKKLVGDIGKKLSSPKHPDGEPTNSQSSISPDDIDSSKTV